MKILVGISLWLWIVISSVVIVSLPKMVSFVCTSNCARAVQVTRIIGGRGEMVDAELSFMELSERKKLFTENEVSHLVDVNQLLYGVKMFWLLLGISLVLMRKYLSEETIWVSAKVGILTTAVIGLTAIVGWESFFVLFHRVFFPQGNWAFPWDSNLLMIFPETFWQRMAGAILFLMVIFLGIFIIFRKRFKTR